MQLVCIRLRLDFLLKTPWGDVKGATVQWPTCNVSCCTERRDRWMHLKLVGFQLPQWLPRSFHHVLVQLFFSSFSPPFSSDVRWLRCCCKVGNGSHLPEALRSLAGFKMQWKVVCLGFAKAFQCWASLCWRSTIVVMHLAATEIFLENLVCFLTLTCVVLSQYCKTPHLERSREQGEDGSSLTV